MRFSELEFSFPHSRPLSYSLSLPKSSSKHAYSTIGYNPSKWLTSPSGIIFGSLPMCNGFFNVPMLPSLIQRTVSKFKHIVVAAPTFGSIPRTSNFS